VRVGWWWENRAEGKVGGGGKSEGKRHPPEAGAKDRSQGKIKDQLDLFAHLFAFVGTHSYHKTHTSRGKAKEKLSHMVQFFHFLY